MRYLVLAVSLAVVSGAIALYSRSRVVVPPAPAPVAGPLTLIYNAEEQPTEKALVGQLLQHQLEARGFKISLQPLPSTAYNDRLGRGDFDATLTLWFLDYDDAEGYLTDFYSKASFRLSKYSNDSYDAAYLRGLQAPTEADRLAAYREAARTVDGDYVWIPLYSNRDVFLLKPQTKGFRANANQWYDYRRVEAESVRTASDVEVQTLDPTQAYDLASKHVVSQSYEGLVALDVDLHVVPALAERWQFSPDARSLTFSLRRGVMFQPTKDGTTHEVTAADVKASFQRVARSSSPYSYIFDHVVGVDDFRAGRASGITGMKAVDTATFRLDFSHPFRTMLQWLLAPAAAILPANLPEKYDFASGSRGTGPFILRTWDGGTARFTANPRYWERDASGRQLPYAKRLSLRVMREPVVMMEAFRRDEVDVVPLPLAMYGDVLSPAGGLTPNWSAYELREVELNNLKFVAFNMRARPWGERLDWRRAFSQAIDRSAIVNALFHGRARVAGSVIPPGVSGFGGGGGSSQSVRP